MLVKIHNDIIIIIITLIHVMSISILYILVMLVSSKLEGPQVHSLTRFDCISLCINFISEM